MEESQEISMCNPMAVLRIAALLFGRASKQRYLPAASSSSGSSVMVASPEGYTPADRPREMGHQANLTPEAFVATYGRRIQEIDRLYAEAHRAFVLQAKTDRSSVSGREKCKKISQRKAELLKEKRIIEAAIEKIQQGHGATGTFSLAQDYNAVMRNMLRANPLKNVEKLKKNAEDVRDDFDELLKTVEGVTEAVSTPLGATPAADADAERALQEEFEALDQAESSEMEGKFSGVSVPLAAPHIGHSGSGGGSGVTAMYPSLTPVPTPGYASTTPQDRMHVSAV